MASPVDPFIKQTAQAATKAAETAAKGGLWQATKDFFNTPLSNPFKAVNFRNTLKAGSVVGNAAGAVVTAPIGAAAKASGAVVKAGGKVALLPVAGAAGFAGGLLKRFKWPLGIAAVTAAAGAAYMAFGRGKPYNPKDQIDPLQELPPMDMGMVGQPTMMGMQPVEGIMAQREMQRRGGMAAGVNPSQPVPDVGQQVTQLGGGTQR